jgi:hypothetical protein
MGRLASCSLRVAGHGLSRLSSSMGSGQSDIPPKERELMKEGGREGGKSVMQRAAFEPRWGQAFFLRGWGATAEARDSSRLPFGLSSASSFHDEDEDESGDGRWGKLRVWGNVL